MTLTIDLTPAEEARLTAAARRAGEAPADVMRKLVTEHLPPIEDERTREEIARNAPSIALLRSWLAEEATDDPDEIRRAEEELAEFKRNMNANRAATGERLLYPEVGPT